MSNRYKGGVISATPPTTSTTAASGAWTLEQQMQAQAAGTWPSPPIFIEDLFSTYLYTGNGSTQTITNGIDLSGKGGLVWIKDRTTGGTSYENALTDTVRGATNEIQSDTTAAQTTNAARLTSFNSDGFSIGNSVRYNQNADNYVSWTFAEQTKFFDVVTWTGNGTTQAISHNLGAVPGFIIIKRTSLAEDWWCFHRYDFTQRFKLNATNAAVDTNNQSYLGNNTVAVTPTSTTFTIGSIGGINSSGDTFVAYLFAHDAGGFPVSGGGSTNGISCGSYTTDGSGNATINLGYEPQWLLQKSSDASGNWFIADVMRGMTANTTAANLLRPNLSNAESGGSPTAPTATGYTVTNYVPSTTYIYIAIRRGPMKPPTTGTSVYGAETWTGTSGSPRTFTSANWTFPTDLVTVKATNTATWWNVWAARLTGGGTLSTNDTGAELSASGSVAGYVSSFNQTGYTAITGTSSINNYNNSGDTYVSYNMRRAPGFFDTVCYTGDGANNRTVTNNLGVAAELIICKCRSTAGVNWLVGIPSISSGYLVLDATTSIASVGTNFFASSSTNISFPVSASQNTSTRTYIAYLFATTAGVSKVGSYTGTGALQTINCGFTSGARFVMIKRIDSTGGWYYYDSVRGITSGSDPYLFFNVSDAEVTGSNFVDTDTTGFKVTAAASSTVNVSGGTYIFLAIA